MEKLYMSSLDLTVIREPAFSTPTPPTKASSRPRFTAAGLPHISKTGTKQRIAKAAALGRTPRSARHVHVRGLEVPKAVGRGLCRHGAARLQELLS